jgi:hypothetical protein
MINILSLLARLIRLFSDLADHLVHIGPLLSKLTVQVYHTEVDYQNLHKRVLHAILGGETGGASWAWELAECISGVAEGICWYTPGGAAWCVNLGFIRVRLMQRTIGAAPSLLT